MYIHLREGEADAVLRELLVNLLVHFIQDAPVVGNLGPCPDDEGHLAVVQTLDIDRGRVIGFGKQGGELRLMFLAQFLGAAAVPVEEALPPGHGLRLDVLVSLLGRQFDLLDVGIGVDDARVGCEDVEGDLAGGVTSSP